MNKGSEQQPKVCFEAKKLKVEDLTASGGEYYVIPPFQRPYRWSNEQVERLVQDLLDCYEIQRGGDLDCVGEYSLGTVVCDRKDSCFSILDGQQRLTTLDLLLETIAEQSGRPETEERRRLKVFFHLIRTKRKASKKFSRHISRTSRTTQSLGRISKPSCAKRSM